MNQSQTFSTAIGDISRFFSLSTRKRLQTIAFLMDESIPLPMMRIGIDPLLSLIPVFGSFLGVAVSSYFFWEAAQLKVPVSIYVRMAANVVIDAALGAIPFAGPLGDAVFKANIRNRKILLKYMDDNGIEVSPVLNA